MQFRFSKKDVPRVIPAVGRPDDVGSTNRNGYRIDSLLGISIPQFHSQRHVVGDAWKKSLENTHLIVSGLFRISWAALGAKVGLATRQSEPKTNIDAGSRIHRSGNEEKLCYGKMRWIYWLCRNWHCTSARTLAAKFCLKWAHNGNLYSSSRPS